MFTAKASHWYGRLDRSVLVGDLVAGALLLVVLALLATWVLVLLGAAYVVAASVLLAAFYGRGSFSRRQEALVWVVPWLGAVLLWMWVGAQIGGGSATLSLLNLWFGLVVATPCYLAWQLLAVAVRQLVLARSADR